MGISFNQLCGYFSHKCVNIVRCDKDLILFNDVKLITKNQTVFLKDIIYIGKTSMLKPQISNATSGSFILSNDSKISINSFFKNSSNIIELHDSEDIYEISNYTRDLFIEEVEIARQTATLLKSAIIGKGLHHIVKVASEILDNPIIVIDASYKVLANSDLGDITDKYWKENIQRGYCSYDFIAEVKKMKNVQNGVKSNEPFEVVCKGSPISKLILNIKIENKYVGNIILLACNRTFLPRDNEFLLLTSQITAEEMKKNIFYRNTKNITYEEIVYDILEGNLTSKEILHERIKSANIKFSPQLSVFIFDISKYSSNERHPGYLTDSFNSFFPLKNSVYYKDNIVVINDNEKTDTSVGVHSKLNNFLTVNKINLGISKEFSNMIECQKYYLQAIKAIEIGKVTNPQSNVIWYTDIQFYDLLSYKFKDFNYMDYYHPALNKLKDYDRLSNTDFYKTLFIYLKNNQSIQKTSEELLIHRNTARYRIQKIIEITKIDISNNENLFNIYVSYKIANYVEKI
jgi:sugar diacid utilization regulator